MRSEPPNTKNRRYLLPDPLVLIMRVLIRSVLNRKYERDACIHNVSAKINSVHNKYELFVKALCKNIFSQIPNIVFTITLQASIRKTAIFL